MRKYSPSNTIETLLAIDFENMNCQDGNLTKVMPASHNIFRERSGFQKTHTEPRIADVRDTMKQSAALVQ